jgi:hypothetical protein
LRGLAVQSFCGLARRGLTSRLPHFNDHRSWYR